LFTNRQELADRNTRPDRHGVIGVWVALSLVVLLGITGLVVDVGRVTVAASHVQNVADAAALAGAAKLPAHAEAEASVQRTIASNNAASQAWSASCAPDQDLTYYSPGDTIPDYGPLSEREHAIEVSAHTTVTYSFARVFGIEQVQVTRSATAKASEGRRRGTGIFFAGETAPNKVGVTMNGSSQYVDGGIHSNTRVTINGSSQTIMGDIEYRNGYIQNGSNFTLEGDWIAGAIEPYPVDYSWDQYDLGPFDYQVSSLSVNGSNETVPSGRWKINGDMRINGSGFWASNSIFVVDGDITFNGSGTVLDQVTLVATGSITMNGTTERFSCFDDGENLFAFSTKSSSSTVLTVNGASSDTWGIIYAPNGGMVYNGANQEIHRGALIAKTITVNGSHGTFCGSGEGGEGDDKVLELIR